MVYHEDLISRIRSIMQEREQSGDFSFELIADDRLRLDDYISDAIPLAVSKLQGVVRGVNVASLDKEESEFFFASVESASGSVITFGSMVNGFDPSRYVGLYRLQLAGWGRAATEVHSEDSEVAKCQYNEYTRARADKPVVVEVKQAPGIETDARTFLYCYPKATDVKDVQVEVTYDASEGLRSASEKVAQAVAYTAAGIVYTQMRMADAAALMAAEADALLKR